MTTRKQDTVTSPRTPESATVGTDIVPAGHDIARRLSWPERSDTPAAIPEDQLVKLLDVIETIPSEGAAGVTGILEQLLAADSLDDLNRPWAGTSGKDLAGKRMSIRGMIRRPSQFADGPQIFLVVDSVDAKTGEPFTWTTSALAVIVQLAMIWKLAYLPALAEVVVADRPTERGYYPYHLLVLAVSGGQRSDG